MKLKFVTLAGLAVVTFCHGAAAATPLREVNAGPDKESNADRFTTEAAISYTADPVTIEPEVLSLIATKWSNHFNPVVYPNQSLNNFIIVQPGSSIQVAIDSASSAGGGVVILKGGTHVLTEQITWPASILPVSDFPRPRLARRVSPPRADMISGDVFLLSRSAHGVQPAGWVRHEGSGRVSILTPGRPAAVWLHPSSQILLCNSLGWVERIEK